MMTKQWLTLVVIALLGLSTINSYAGTQATEKSIKELLVLTGAANLGIQIIQNILPNMKQLVPDAPESFWTEFMKEVNPDEMMALVIPIYQKYFTEHEIQEILKFYKSPTGQKVIQNLPQVTQESMVAGQQWGQMLGQRVVEKARAQRTKSP